MEWWVRGRAIEGMMLTATEESNGNRPSSNNVRLKEAKPIEIDGRDIIWSVAFLANGKHVVSGGKEGKIRCWQIEDGKEAARGANGCGCSCDRYRSVTRQEVARERDG
jgi:WD40 repeat protein